MAIEHIIAGASLSLGTIWEAYFNWYRSAFTPSRSWFFIAILLLLLELLVPLPTLLIAGAMGLSALFVALILSVVYFPLAIQILIWIGVSGVFIWYSRRFIPKTALNLKEATEGITIAEIPMGESGRVQYEGGSWRARCDNPKISIPVGEKVYILRRQGTTLIVVPEYWLQEHSHD